MMADDFREPFGRRYHAILCVESDDPNPVMMFRSEEAARAELDRRKALDPDHDDHLSDDYTVLPVDVAGALWNSFDPDPRVDDPLDAEEIAALHDGSPDPSESAVPSIADTHRIVDAGRRPSCSRTCRRWSVGSCAGGSGWTTRTSSR
jgi:hypothetical protein